MTRDELALANMKFLKECINGEYFSDFDEKDLLNIVCCAKSLSYSLSTCEKLEALCKTIDNYIEQKSSNPVVNTKFFVLSKFFMLIENEVQSIIEDLISNVHN